MASATRATRVILPKAVTKSLQAYSWCSLPLTIFQPRNLGRRALISASVNFFAGMACSSGRLSRLRFHYEPGATTGQQCGGVTVLADWVARHSCHTSLCKPGWSGVRRVALVVE